MGKTRLRKEVRYKYSTWADSEETPFNCETYLSSHILWLPSIQIPCQDHSCQKPSYHPVPLWQPRFLDCGQFSSGLPTEELRIGPNQATLILQDNSFTMYNEYCGCKTPRVQNDIPQRAQASELERHEIWILGVLPTAVYHWKVSGPI